MPKATHYAIIGILIFIVSSCGFYKNALIWEKGNVNQSEFYSEIPFEYRAGIPVIEIEINGVKAKFLFDTGAPNVISEDLATTLNLNTKSFGKINDSGGNSSKEGRKLLIDSIKIGTVTFLETNALVMDLQSSFVFNCLGFDGIIGANLMRMAKWKIDYKNQNISFTNDISKFNISDSIYNVPFKTKSTYTPVITLKLDTTEIPNVTFDTGSNGDISVSAKNFKNISEANSNIIYTVSKGATNYGVYGKSKNDSTIFARIPSVSFGDVVLESQIVEFKQHSNILGTQFFKNYAVILNWDTKNITLLQHSDYSRKNLIDYGFKLDIRDSKLYVGSIFDDSTMIKSGVQVGDQILTVNNKDVSQLSQDEACNIIVNQQKIATSDSAIFVFKNENNTTTKSLQKRPLLPLID